ncbi:hypothetical protein Ddye_011205 [Dipteronia dyeriana]|uniref:Uncharacterized protein n=1 Tax=Dipteronia dyeriana TaxID=168575 RepID=A0AAD9UC22_9ROSI|nr:hypothetical protein Ddye_011205 [Dipteronia dyeriana]
MKQWSKSEDWIIPVQNQVDSLVIVKVGNCSFKVRIKENPSPVTASWVNNLLGLKPETKSLNLPPLKDGSQLTPFDDCQLDGDHMAEKMRGKLVSEVGKRNSDMDYLSRKYGVRKRK